MISAHTFLSIELVAAAVLALWVVVRFPKVGPTSLAGAVVVLAAGLGAMEVLPSAMVLLLRLPHGVYAALFGGALPAFFAVFLAAGWVMRLLAGAFGGSNRGGGHHVPAAARG